MVHPARATYDAKTAATQDAFLLAFAQCGSMSRSAAAAGVNPIHVRHHWINHDVLGFAQRFAHAQSQFADYLEQLALKRVEEPTFNGRIGSDVLLMGLLNANHPTKWRKDVHVTHDLGQRVIATLQRLQAQDRGELPSGQVVEGEGQVVDDEKAA